MLGGLKDSTGLHLQSCLQTPMWTLRFETSISLLLLVSMHNLLFYPSPEDWESVSGSHQQDRPYVKIRLPCQARLQQSSGRVPSRKSGKGNICKHCMNSCHVTLNAHTRTHNHIINCHINSHKISNQYDISKFHNKKLWPINYCWSYV